MSEGEGERERGIQDVSGDTPATRYMATAGRIWSAILLVSTSYPADFPVITITVTARVSFIGKGSGYKYYYCILQLA